MGTVDCGSYKLDVSNDGAVKLIFCDHHTDEGQCQLDLYYRNKVNYLRDHPELCTYDIMEKLYNEALDIAGFSNSVEVVYKEKGDIIECTVNGIDITNVYSVSLVWIIKTYFKALDKKRKDEDVSHLMDKIDTTINTNRPNDTNSDTNIITDIPDEESTDNPITRDGIWFLFSMLRQKGVINQMSDTKLSSIVNTLTGYSIEKLRQSKLHTQSSKDKVVSLLEDIISKIKA